MSSTLKVDILQDSGGNNIISSDGSGDLTIPTGKLSGHMYPAFEASLSADQTLTDATNVKIQYDNEIFDTDGYYDNTTNYRFTPLVAGKYFVYTQNKIQCNTSNTMVSLNLYIYKNGSNYRTTTFDPADNQANSLSITNSAVIDMNGSTDYVEVFAYVNVTGSNNGRADKQTESCYFGAYRIGD